MEAIKVENGPNLGKGDDECSMDNDFGDFEPAATVPQTERGSFDIESPLRDGPSQANMVAHSFHTTKEEESVHKLSWYNGVMIPTCENMWGVLIFLRFYYIVGHAGVAMTLVLVFVSFTNACLTTISLSAIASSGGHIGREGPYYMISRSLGPYTGVSVGIVYWLALTLLAVLETLGAVETLHNAMGYSFPGSVQVFATILWFALAAIVFVGIRFVSKLGIVFFIIVLLTLAMYYIGLGLAPQSGVGDKLTGLSTSNLSDNAGPDYDSGVSFSVVLSIFYPCFTGILSGANRSKNLKNPSKDIPKGTFAAITLSLFMYSSFMILWGAVADREYLKGNDLDRRRLAGGSDGGQIVKDIAWPHPIVVETGIIIASLSQALQCMIVAAKLFARIAQDQLVPRLNWFGKMHNNEPKRALLITYIVAALLCLIGSLDVVAPMLTMCFLMMYSVLNLACLILTILKTPGWRPKGIQSTSGRVFYIISSLLGWLLSLTLMFLVMWYWALVVLFIFFALYTYVSCSGVTAEWGSGIQGIKFQVALSMLHNLDKEKEYTLNWRPQILALYKYKENYPEDQFTSAVEQLHKSGGLVIVVCAIMGDPLDLSTLNTLVQHKTRLRHMLKSHQQKVFPRAFVSRNMAECLSSNIQTAGLGHLKPNTVFLELPVVDDPNHMEEVVDFANIIKICTTMNHAVIAVKDVRTMPVEDKQRGFMDIWWIIHDGGLLLLLSYLLNQHKIWQDCIMRVFVVAEDHHDKEKIKAEIEENCQLLRFEVVVKIIAMEEEAIDFYTHDWTIRLNNRNNLMKQIEDHDIRHHRRPSLARSHTLVDVLDEHKGHEHIKHPAPPALDKVASTDSPSIGSMRRDPSFTTITNEKYKKLNQRIRQESQHSSMILLTLPEPYGVEEDEDCRRYWAFLNTLSEGLQRVIFIHGSGTEIIQATPQ